MKRKIVVALILFILCGCSSKQAVDETVNQPNDELYIEFVSDVIEIESGTDIDYLGGNIIKSSSGNVILSATNVNTSMPGEYFIQYNVVNEDWTESKSYEVKIVVVGDSKSYTAEGYPSYTSLVYVMDYNDFVNVETRFTPQLPVVQTDGTMWPILDNQVGIALSTDRKVIIQRGATVSGKHNYWEGDYELVGDNLYHVTNLHEVGENPQPGNYEAYFYLSSFNQDGKIYYFMDHPGNEINPDNPYFEYKYY